MKYHYPGGFAEIDLETATYEELLEAQARISDMRGIIQSKIDEAEADRKMGGRGADPRDYARWKRLRRSHGSQLREINQAMAKLAAKRKQERRVRNDTLLQCFMDTARVMLHKDDFADIMLAAQAQRDRMENDATP